MGLLEGLRYNMDPKVVSWTQLSGRSPYHEQGARKHCDKDQTEAQEMEKKYTALFDAVEAQNQKVRGKLY
jgi:hypothetical protein